jgi:hypothetical protein
VKERERERERERDWMTMKRECGGKAMIDKIIERMKRDRESGGEETER